MPEISTNIQKASAWQRTIAVIVDAIVILIIIYEIYVYLDATFPNAIGVFKYPELLFILVLGIYRFCSLCFFNNTLGMRISKIKYLSQEHETLSMREKFWAGFFILLPGIDYFK